MCSRHVVTCACAYVRAHVCICVRAGAYVYMVYTGRIALSFVMWDYFCLFLFVGDVARSRVDDHLI